MNQMIGMPGLLRINHVGIAVQDLDMAIEWYKRILGAKLTSREINLEQMVEEATVNVNESAIQLLAPLSKLSPISKFLATKGQGVQQIAFEVSNLSDAVDFALNNNIRVLFEESKEGSRGSRINFLHPSDCFGVLIELVEL